MIDAKIHVVKIDHGKKHIKIDKSFDETLINVRTKYKQRLKAVNYYHKALHLGCCSSPRPASDYGTVKHKHHKEIVSFSWIWG